MNNIYKDYLLETECIDFTNPVIQMKVRELKQNFYEKVCKNHSLHFTGIVICRSTFRSYERGFISCNHVTTVSANSGTVYVYRGLSYGRPDSKGEYYIWKLYTVYSYGQKKPDFYEYIGTGKI